MKYPCALFCLLLLCSPHSHAMTMEELATLIASKASQSHQQAGSVFFEYQGVNMIMMSDSQADRMRIMAPVDDLDGHSTDHLLTLMEANFHSALDARYALRGTRIYALYLHPLSSLAPAEASAAMDQVANLAHTYGTSYNSTGLHFQR